MGAAQNERYRITSSAVANSVSGMVRPSAFAVLRLRTISYLVGASPVGRPDSHPLRRLTIRTIPDQIEHDDLLGSSETINSTTVPRNMKPRAFGAALWLIRRQRLVWEAHQRFGGAGAVGIGRGPFAC
jgi:hypothetical protein